MAWSAATQPTWSVWEDVRQTVCKQDTIRSWLTKQLKQKDFVSSSLPGYCASGVMRNPTMWLGIFVGGWVPKKRAGYTWKYTYHMNLHEYPHRIFTVLLMIYRVRGAILIGIFLVSIVSWPRDTPVTYFPHTPNGDALFDYFKQVVNFRRLEKIGNVLDVSAILFLFLVSVADQRQISV